MPESFASTREAILVFHFADRMKAELLLASRLLATLQQLKEPELTGGQRVFLEFLRGLDQEVALGQSLIRGQELVKVRTVLTGLLGMVESGLLAEVQGHLTWIVSQMTTYAQRAMEFLLSKDLL
jgi:hypothetical protein